MAKIIYYMVFQSREFGKWQDKEIFECNSKQDIKPILLHKFNKHHAKLLERYRSSKNAKSRHRVIHRACRIDDI